MNTQSHIQTFLDQDEKKDLLRFLTAGSVDDGKSTLIGRLLYDCKRLYEDQLEALKRDSQRFGNAGDHTDYALLLDGLKAEREQGITIDVAYRYFSTNRRKFIIADTPGHEQYTRNMITGGSTAELAVILVDACTGITTQTRRHTYLVSLLGIQHVVLAVNKMDLVGYNPDRFYKIIEDYNVFIQSLKIPNLTAIPLSALLGDNVARKSEHMKWYTGKTLLDFLETVPLSPTKNLSGFRYPIQYVLRPDASFRGFSGTIASGIIRKGAEVIALPSGRSSRIKSIVTYDGQLKHAFFPQSITLTLEDEIDLSRGEMLVTPNDLPHTGQHIEAELVWMDEKNMDLQTHFYLKHTTRLTRADIQQVLYKTDINHLQHLPARSLKLNEIGRVILTTHQPLFFDPYHKNKATGSFILIDPVTNHTSAVGMIVQPAQDVTSAPSPSVRSHITKQMREQQYRQQGHIYTFTGKDAPAKAYQLEKELFEQQKVVTVLESQYIPDIEHIATILCEQGFIVICIFN